MTPIYTFYLLYSKRNKLDDLKVKQRIGSLFCEFKNDKGFASSLFYLVFFIRRLQYLMTQLLLSDYWYIQYGLNLFFTLFQFGYFLYFRPFKERLVLYSELIGETCVLVIFVFSALLFPGQDHKIAPSTISPLIIYTIMLSLGMQTILSTGSLVLVIKSWYNNYKKYKMSKQIKKANKIYPDKEISTMSDVPGLNPNSRMNSLEN